jgi:hypothetical protein
MINWFKPGMKSNRNVLYQTSKTMHLTDEGAKAVKIGEIPASKGKYSPNHS